MRTGIALRLVAYFLLAVGFGLLLGVVPSAVAQEDKPIQFEDPALERAVRGQLADKDASEPLYASEVEKIERLAVEWPDDEDRIASLAGIEALTNLTYLNLRDHDVADLQPLAGLANLEMLLLRRNRVTSVAPLSELQRLERLDLAKNQVVNADGLAGLSELRFVNLSENRLQDVSGLAGLEQLGMLMLHENALADVSALSELPSLARVSLYANPDLDTCADASARQVIEELTADGAHVAYEERGSGGAACAEYASAEPVRITMETGGQQESMVVDDGRLARLNPDGTRVVASCAGSAQPVHFINEERGIYWYGPMREFAKQLSNFIAVQLLPDDPEVRYAVDVQVQEAGEEEIVGYTAQQYRVEWRPHEDEGGADEEWALMQELWVAAELGAKLKATGCFDMAAFLEARQLMQGAFSSQRFYGLSRSRDYGEAATGGFPVRAVMYAPASDETITTQVIGVDDQTPAAELFELPEGLERAKGISEVF